MITVTNKLSVLALSMAASVAINLAGYSLASAKEPTRKPAYSEGLWKEPVQPSKPADPSASVHGIGAKPPPSSAQPPISR